MASSRAAPLTAFYKTQGDALKAARARGVDEVEVTFRPNVAGAANIRTKIKVEEFALLWGFGQPKKSRAAADKNEPAPSPKLVRAMKEAREVTTYYDTKSELFDALEKQG